MFSTRCAVVDHPQEMHTLLDRGIPDRTAPPHDAQGLHRLVGLRGVAVALPANRDKLLQKAAAFGVGAVEEVAEVCAVEVLLRNDDALAPRCRRCS